MQAVLKGALGPALVLIGLGVRGALLGSVLSLAIAGLVGTSMLFSRGAGIRVKVTNPTDAMRLSIHSRRSRHTSSSDPTSFSASGGLRALVGYGLPLYVAAILSVFVTQYQNIVLAHFASNVEIGNFGATWNFTTLMMILVYPIQTAMFPMFSKMDPESQRSDLARGFVLAVKYTSLLMIPASVAVMIFSRDLIYLTYGSAYTFAPQYLLLLSALYLLTVISYLVLGSFLYGVAENKTYLKMNILTLTAYLPLGPFLAWLWGPYGLLVAYILSNATSIVYGIRRTSAKYDARPNLRAGGRILFAALVAAVPTIALIQLDRLGVGAVNLIVGGLLYVLVYLTLTPIAGAVDKQDILNLRNLMSGTRAAATFMNPIFNYESKLLSAIEQRVRGARESNTVEAS
jgi:O-antigen/teichoic acid export membrane protein